MTQPLTKNWWLLALCAVLDAILAVMNVRMFVQGPLAVQDTAMDMCRLAVAAGVCTIAAGIWSSRKGSSWLLVLNGLALSAYGLLPIVWKGPLSFRLFALLIAVMAIGIGIFAWAAARTPRRHVADKWSLGLAGAVSIGFAAAFLALGFSWINLEPGLYWRGFLLLGSYFGFSALCMLGFALRLQSPGPAESGPWEALPPLGNPKHAH